MSMRPGDSRIRSAVLKSWAAFLVMVMLSGLRLVASQDSGARWTMGFRANPIVPRPSRPSILPVMGRFAGRGQDSGRRLLAYFTGEFCGWRRALEKRT